MARHKALALFICCVCLFVIHTECFDCKNENNENVDWFIVYKLPKIHKSTIPLVQEGLGYLYMDADNQQWTLGTVSLNDTNQAIAHTLNQIYKNYKSDDVSYAMYNDEIPPKIVFDSTGHTKGVIAFEKKGGLWLVHSVPRFPPKGDESYSYPKSATHFGQTFLCMSLDYKYLNEIGIQFIYNYPHIVDYHLPEAWEAENPDLSKVLHGNNSYHVSSPPWSHMLELVSKRGQKFTSFAKYSRFNADLYSTWIAPYYKSDLYVESWMRSDRLPSNCTGKYKVYNVEVLQLDKVDQSIKETQDHSKWAVTAKGTWTCIGDINRGTRQVTRAGGTVCFDIPKAWSAFSKAINKTEICRPSFKAAQIIHLDDPRLV